MLAVACGLALLAAMTHLPNAGNAARGKGCDGRERYVAPAGSDRSRGTREHPWRSLRRAFRLSRPGDTIYVRSGTYGAVGRSLELRASGSRRCRILFSALGGESKPVVLGFFPIFGSNVTVSGFVFDGPTGPIGGSAAEIQVRILGDRVTLRDSEIRESGGAAGLLIGENGNPAEGFRIRGNWIHDNGRFSNAAAANFDHGIYVSSGSGLIARNLVEQNYAFGIHLYPSASHVTVRRNTIVGHGRSGVIIAGASGAPLPSHNRVVKNVIAYNRQNAVRTFPPIGPGNVVRGNRVWENGEGDFHDPAGGLSLSRNISAR
jgi:parallel beta-helix repeat protein